MAKMPKRVKYRKSQRGKMRGEATRGNRVDFGDYGLQALERAWISSHQIEAGRVAIGHYLRDEGKLIIRIFPHKSITAKPVKTCPECGGPVQRMLGIGSAVIFKGPGFYATDYGTSKRS